MAISERVNSEELNIHHFQETPEDRAELPFDVERDVDPTKRDELLSEIEKAKDTDLTHYVFLMTRFKFLWPNVNTPTVPESEIENKHSQLVKSDIRNQTRSVYSAFVCEALRLGYNLKLTKDDQQILSSHVSAISYNSFDQWIRPAADIKLIDPDVYREKIENTGHASIEEMVKIENSLRSTDRLSIFREYAAYMRLLNSDYKPNFTKEEWKELNEYLNGIVNPTSFAEVAWQMKILAAHNVEVTAPGVIDIQMYPPEDLNNSTPSIPETRKF